MAEEKSNAESYLDELYQELSGLLGEAVWAFSRIEWLTYEFVGHLTDEGVAQLLDGVSFRSRTSMLKKLVNRGEWDRSVKDEAVAALKVVNKLSEDRNVFVHNPWKVYVDFDKREFEGELRKYTDERKAVRKEELRQFIESCKEAQERLENAFKAL